MKFRFLDQRTASDLIKLLVFIVITSFATLLLAGTIGNAGGGSTKSYRAVFSDATGVVSGDDVRIAGVRVGSVGDIEIKDRNQALLEIKVDEDVAVLQNMTATIRFRNLVGQRYVSLAPGTGGTSSPLAEGATLPITQTRPALDLTVLFNGFKPLFRALSPADVNKLAFEIIQVFQGEGGTLRSLLQRTASVTNTLADRDDVISALITNLNDTLEIVGERDDQLSDLVIQLRQFIGGLNQDRNAILGSLDGISALANQTASLVKDVRPSLTEDISQLRRLARNLDNEKNELDRQLKVLPIKLEKVGRTAIYGSFFNFYLCEFKGQIRLPGGLPPVPLDYEVGGRCNIG